MNRPIMVIDDSPTICKIIEVCLMREGFEVKTFSDGVEALCWLHDNPAMPAPALAFIDLNLPKLSQTQIWAARAGNRHHFATRRRVNSSFFNPQRGYAPATPVWKRAGSV